jgi:DNA-3-methyladenine glycosylase II
MQIFVYGQEEVQYLKKKDAKLGAAMDEIGMIQREITPDPFTALVSCIVSQQISKKAAATVWDRLEKCLGSFSPESIARSNIQEIQGCGMSARKAGYIKGIAEAALSGRVEFNILHTLPDEEVIRTLSSLHGVGVWTAEMVLIFSLGRPDIVSFGDLAIRRGMQNLYGLPEVSRAEFDHYRKNYSPYGSVASLYLWALSIM